MMHGNTKLKFSTVVSSTSLRTVLLAADSRLGVHVNPILYGVIDPVHKTVPLDSVFNQVHLLYIFTHYVLNFFLILSFQWSLVFRFPD